MSYSIVSWRNRLPQTVAELDGFMNQLFSEQKSPKGDFYPWANFAETEAGYELTLDLPGLDPADVNIELHDGKLTISGERQAQTENEGKTFHRVESRYGKFERVVALPKKVEQENINASFKNGVLTVTLPKTEEVKPKRIEVSAE